MFRVFIKSGLLLVSLLSLPVIADSNERALQQMLERQAIEQQLIGLVNSIDTKQWQTAVEYFTDSVYVDYSSLSGERGKQTSSSELVSGWSELLQKISTLHQLSNFEIQINGDRAESFAHVYASHNQVGTVHFWDAYGRYQHQLVKQNGQWKITGMTLLLHGQKGDSQLLSKVNAMNNTSNQRLDIEFLSDGSKLSGHLYLPDNYDPNKQYAAVIVSGSWTTVKEQMAGLYARRLANQDLIALAFDFRGYGNSEGQPRYFESPSRKVADIKNAVTYLQSLPQVNEQRVGVLGVCAGAMYSLIAASEDERIKSVVTVASWLHDAEAVKLFYGGEQGVAEKIERSRQAQNRFEDSGELAYIPTISTTDDSAAMYGPYDYYLNPERGAIAEWSADKFAVMSWEGWLTLDPMPSADKLSAPTLMIHSDGAVLPDYTRKYFKRITSNEKQLVWLETNLESPYHQFSFYDQEQEVAASIKHASEWFAEKLVD